MNVVTQFTEARDFECELRFQGMFEGAAIGIGICQLDGRMVEVNPALSRMLGYSRQELTAERARDLYPQPGSEIYSEAPSPYECAFGQLMRGERDSFQIEKCYQRKDGSEFWGHLTLSLARDTRRQPAFLIAMLADATGHKRLADHLREAEKLEIIGRLAGGVAHDFNNLLTGILLYCDLITAELEKGRLADIELTNAGLTNGGLANDGLANDRVRSGALQLAALCQHVEEVRMAGEQGAALTQQLLAVARKQAAELRPVAINEIVASTENLLRRLIGEQIELVTALDSGVGPVLADPGQVRQVLLNLVLNARDAMPEGGKIRLITRAVKFPAKSPADISSRASSRDEPVRRCAVSLAVKDNGCGMNAETRARLFEPFFTTKKEGQGTGLGLATVQRIVSEAGGMIEVESEPGHGTCIEVLFPAIESPIVKSVVKSSIGELAAEIVSTETLPPVARFAGQTLASKTDDETARKTILLVDDHATARNSMQRILLGAGYCTLPAAGPKQALTAFAEHAAEVDMVIADCLLPGMKGQELAESLRRQKPDLKILLISGYQSAPLKTASGAVELIRKPFSKKALLDRVVEVMRSP
jgi:PAS domain S-box-containing protein